MHRENEQSYVLHEAIQQKVARVCHREADEQQVCSQR